MDARLDRQECPSYITHVDRTLLKHWHWDDSVGAFVKEFALDRWRRIDHHGDWLSAEQYDDVQKFFNENAHTGARRGLSLVTGIPITLGWTLLTFAVLETGEFIICKVTTLFRCQRLGW